jgi:hypothetical protein
MPDSSETPAFVPETHTGGVSTYFRSVISVRILLAQKKNSRLRKELEHPHLDSALPRKKYS